jgi:hypothetical protein
MYLDAAVFLDCGGIYPPFAISGPEKHGCTCSMLYTIALDLNNLLADSRKINILC